MTISKQSDERLRNVQAQMVANGVDLVAIGPTANMRYLLGFAPLALKRLCVLMIRTNSTRLIAGKLSADELEAHTGMEVIPWADEDGPYSTVVNELKTLGVPLDSVLAVDDGMRADALLLLLETINPKKQMAAGPLLDTLRICKSETEIEALSRAAAQADRALKVGADACRPGVTEREVANKIATYFLQDGAEAVDFTIIASGPNGAFPHHHPGDRRLQNGDTVIIDVGATLNGYKSDVSRTVHLGKPTAEVQAIYQAVVEATQSALQAVTAGVPAHTIDDAARGSLEQAGYASYFVCRTGHGLGLETHEPPWITAVSDTILRPGMVFSIEPGVYMQGKLGMRVEDIVVVTEDGHRRLTGLDYELIIND
ncbi:MAG: M24 family metallopeptidase [Planctomycetota bacterium]|jgi:Xaa-Pro aminopeptidase